MHISIRASLYGILALLVLTIGGLGVLAWTQLDETLDLSVQAQEGVQLAHIVLQRETDHIQWALQLAESFNRREPFTGQLDPHYCAFGSWYGEFIHSEEFAALPIELQASFLAMDQPHRDLHKSAQDITNRLIESNYSQDAWAEARIIYSKPSLT